MCKNNQMLNSLKKVAEQTIDFYNKIHESDPVYIDAQFRKGCALYSLGKFEEAIACYDKVIKIDESDLSAYNNKGCALYSIGKNKQSAGSLEAVEYYFKAIKCYNEATNINPDYIYATLNKSIALKAIKKYQIYDSTAIEGAELLQSAHFLSDEAKDASRVTLGLNEDNG